MKANTQIIVLCESSNNVRNNNSIFTQQVLNSIDPIQKNILISFENQNSKNLLIEQLTQSNPELEIIQLGNLHLFGFLSIKHNVRQLKKILAAHDNYEVTAHGAIAGLICKDSIEPLKCYSLTIKAYSLLAAEYEYAQSNKTSFMQQWWRSLKAWHYRSIEKKAYTSGKKLVPIYIETISSALKEFIFNTYGADYERLRVISYALYNKTSQEMLDSLKKEIRQDLNIPANAQVYCYYGSMDALERPQESIAYFKQQLIYNNQSYLLIVSKDQQGLSALLAHNELTQSACQIVWGATQEEVNRYLTACDIGILMRDHHIIHWISKPATAIAFLEAGLEIAHNNTVAWLAKEDPIAKTYSQTMDEIALSYDKKIIAQESHINHN